VVNGYRIEAELGRGGMGTVYEAVQLSLERPVALKIMAPDVNTNPQFHLRFRREALIQASLTHPHIVTVHDAGEFEGTMYIVMRLIRGTTLKGLINEGSLSPAQLLNLLEQVADALDAAHAQKLVHRDVKPQNILVKGGTKAYLADFGLTRMLTAPGFTVSGQFLGTVRYIAPEQIVGELPTGAADVYSLTAVLYEGLTGSVPFERTTDVAILFAHTADPPPRPSTEVPALPPAIDDVIARGMAKDPADRYATATALIEAARAALGPSRSAVL
jgi:serine/threonine-protein kinase